MDLFFQTTEGFSKKQLRDVIGAHISESHPNEMRKWSTTTDVWSTGAAELVATSYAPTEQGLKVLLANDDLVTERRAHILAMYIRKIAPDRYPPWFSEYARGDATFVKHLLAGATASISEAAEELQKVIHHIRPLPLAFVPDLFELMQQASGAPYFPSLSDALMRNVLEGRISGRLDSEECLHWQSSLWARGVAEVWIPKV